MIGKTWADLTHPQDRPAEESQFKRMLEGAVEGYQLEKRFCGKNGRTVHANLSVRCMRNEDRTVDCVLAWVQESDRHEATEGSVVAIKPSTLSSDEPEKVTI